MNYQTTQATVTSQRTFLWLDQLKGVALLWIMLVHAVERMYGPPLFSNPSPAWPPLVDRITQFMPIDGLGLATIPVNLFRYVGWFGDQGVQLFLLCSGFGLTWSLLWKSGSAAKSVGKNFYQRRLFRLYPLWWAMHLLIGIVVTLVAIPDMGSLLHKSFYLSFLGIRFLPNTFYYITPCWWFMGLLIQLYLIYPLLYKALRRVGPARLLGWTCLIALTIRGAGLFVAGDYIDLWSRGNLFITRLPEFVLGISLAGWFHQSPVQTDLQLKRWPVQVMGAVVYVLGLVTAFTYAGMTVSPFLLGLGAFILIYGLLQGPLQSGFKRLPLSWLGRHSYAIFLVHHPLFKLLVPMEQTSLQAFIGMFTAFGVSIVLAIGIEQLTNWSTKQVQQKVVQWG